MVRRVLCMLTVFFAALLSIPAFMPSERVRLPYNPLILSVPVTDRIIHDWEFTFGVRATMYILFEHRGELWMVVHGNEDNTVWVAGMDLPLDQIVPLLQIYERKELLDKYKEIHVHSCYCGRWPHNVMSGGKKIVPSQRSHTGTVSVNIENGKFNLWK